MRIIISPAKKMKTDTDFPADVKLPQFIKEAEILAEHIKCLSYEKLKEIWKCNDKIAALNYQRFQNMNLYKNLTPAILSYEGIQYKYMSPDIFSNEEFTYIDEHLRIMSGFYGLLRPFDGITPYRLEMQARLNTEELNSLYDFWGRKLAERLFSESRCIINLASKEYSRCISDYLEPDIQFITCVFGEIKDEKVIEKGTQVKMARGEMVRYMAENKAMDAQGIKNFNRLNYLYEEKLSDDNTYVFIKGGNNNVGKKH